MFIIKTIIEILAFLIGMFGGAIILIGVIKAAKAYIEQKHDSFFQHARLTLSQHLLLGLDFLVAKDILDTLVLERSTNVLFHIVVLVGLRILLTHFVNKEMQELKELQLKKKKRAFKKRKPNTKQPPNETLIA